MATNNVNTDAIESGLTASDAVKVTTTSVKFGPTRIMRGPTVPTADQGRNGDLFILDDTATASEDLQSSQIPSQASLYQKRPAQVSSGPVEVLSLPGGLVAANGDSITINALPVVFSGGDLTTVAADIEAVFASTTTPITVQVVPSSQTGAPNGMPMSPDSLGIDLGFGITPVVFSAPFTLDNAIVQIQAAGIPDLIVNKVNNALVLTALNGNPITLTNLAGNPTGNLGPFTQNGGAIRVTETTGTAGLTFASPVGASAVTLDNRLTNTGPSPTILGGEWVELGVGGGGRWVWNVDHFESTSDGVTLAQVRVPTTPINDNDAASKIYVDSVASGVDAKQSVRAASTAAGTLASDFEAGDVIDGVTLVAGDRILIKNQAAAAENGIYVVEATGAPTRADDADGVGELSGGTFVFVEEGTTLADTGWVITSNGSLTPGVDANDWVQFSAAGGITAGIGLSQAGSVFNVNTGAATIAVNGSDDLVVDSSANAGQVLLSAGTVGTEAIWGGVDLTNPISVLGLLPQNRGGTGTAMSGFTQESLVVVGPTNNLVELGIGTNGNVLNVSGGVASWGQIDISDNTNTVTGVLDETNGGTGVSTYAEGDILIGTGVDTLGTLAIGAAATVLTSNGTTATWTALPSNSGAVQTVQAVVPLTAAGVVPIGAILPAGAYALETAVNVNVASDAATTVTIGDAGDPARLMGDAANDPEEAVNFTTQCEFLYAAATQVNATVATPGTVGSATVTVRYIQP